MNPNNLCVVISAPTFEQAQQQIIQAVLFADLLEFRLDFFQFSLSHIKELFAQTTLPIIFTLRKESHGGQYKLSEKERLKTLEALLTLEPKFIDLEWDTDPIFFQEIARNWPNIKIICSAHNFSHTPQNLEELFYQMQQLPGHIFKLAMMANSSLDSLRMLAFVRKQQSLGKLISGVCLGPYGEPTRILGPIFGSCITYAALDSANLIAPGQLDAETLITTYSQKKLTRKTQIFGLIGDPVSKSISHIKNNASIAALKKDAVYVKMRVSSNELSAFLQEARQLGISGLSVTMPLKEQVCKYVDHSSVEASKIGAVNTLSITPERIVGHNTDGYGALKAIQTVMEIQGKHVVIIGAGGVAKAIAYSLHHAGAKLTILNRTREKADQLANLYGATSGSLEQFSEIACQGYDLLINCTSLGMLGDDDCAIALDCLLEEKVVMETITRPAETLLIKEAIRKKCRVIYGETMFRHQAEKQFDLWNQI